MSNVPTVAGASHEARRLGRVALVLWDPCQRRPRALFRLGALVAMMVATGRVLGMAANATAWRPPRGLLDLMATALSLWLAARFLDRRPFSDYGFRINRAWWADLRFGLFLGALLMTIVFCVEWAAGWVTVKGTFITFDPGGSFVPDILSPLGQFVAIGIVEEMFARGYFLRNVAESINVRRIGPRMALVSAWVLSSLVFGLLHAGNPNATLTSTVGLAIAGAYLGLGYVLTGSLAIPIGLHISWNFFEGNVYGFPVSGASFGRATVIAISQVGPELWTGGAFGPESGLLGLAAILIGTGLLLLWVRARHGRLGLATRLAEPAGAGAVIRAEVGPPEIRIHGQ